MPWISQQSPKLYWKLAPQKQNNHFIKLFKCSIFNGTRFSQPKYHIPRWKTVTSSSKPKIYFFLMSQGSLNPKIRFLGQNVWPVARSQTDTRTHRVTTEGTLSGFQDFFLLSRIGPILIQCCPTYLICMTSIVCVVYLKTFFTLYTFRIRNTFKKYT